MLSSIFPSSTYGEHQASYPLQGFEAVHSENPNYFCLSEPNGGLDDILGTRASAPCPPVAHQTCPTEATTIYEITTDELYNEIQSSNRLQAIEADLARTLMSEINVLDSSVPLPSTLDLLTNRRRTYNLFNGDKTDATPNPIEPERELSTEEIMRVAAVRFIQSSAYKDPRPTIYRYSFNMRLSFSGLKFDEIRNIGLASLLLAAAEKLSSKQYDRARRIITECYRLSSSTGNPVQRVVYHFSEAMQERIDRQTNKPSNMKRPREPVTSDINKVMLAANSFQLVFHEKIPFSRMMQFISVQAIIDAVASATRIHVIDFSLRHGVQWTVLIQELTTRTTCPVEYLKVTAVGTASEAIAMSGERLGKFAQSIGLNFKFETVVVTDMADLREEMFDTEEGEVLGVYFSLCMNTMIVNPGDLEHIMKVLEDLKPVVVTVVDVEGKHNSPSFINRFTEALFYYSALFDSMDMFMERNDRNRMMFEGKFFSESIKSIVAAEGSDRLVRHVGIKMWRSFFARFGLMECELNEWSPYQAGLIAKQFKNGSSCSLHRNGKSLMVGWKGTPLFFISAWKFSRNLDDVC